MGPLTFTAVSFSRIPRAHLSEPNKPVCTHSIYIDKQCKFIQGNYQRTQKYRKIWSERFVPGATESGKANALNSLPPPGALSCGTSRGSEVTL